jgi:hypothetical protein
MNRCINFLHDLGFSKDKLNRMAVETGFIERFRDLDGLDYVLALILNVTKEVVSFNIMASTFLGNANKSVSKQAMHTAMSKNAFIDFIDKIFNELIQTKLGISNSKFKSKFKRIIIQDSTIIKLPKRLFEKYSGVKNQSRQVANARVQVALDILTNQFTLFSIDPYSINDLSAACKLEVRKGDLIIRDRGYCRITELLRIMACKANFIYRYYHKFNYYDLDTGHIIDMYKLVKKEKNLRVKVRVGDPKGPIVTLFADKVSNELANKRRCKLKQSSKSQPSKELLQLLSWSIYFTSIDDEQITSDDICDLYRLRWRIEIIFKAMKSHLNFDKIHNVSENQLKFILIGRMIWLLIITQIIYPKISKIIFDLFGKIVSLIKLISYLNQNAFIIAEILQRMKRKALIESDTAHILSKYCCYDLRKKRNNFQEQFMDIHLS